VVWDGTAAVGADAVGVTANGPAMAGFTAARAAMAGDGVTRRPVQLSAATMAAATHTMAMRVTRLTMASMTTRVAHQTTATTYRRDSGW
jgi:hypothetical protein